VIADSILAQSTTWDLSNSPYYLDGELQVPQGVVLTIEPGVKIVARGGSIKVAGSVTASGTSTSKIIIEKGIRQWAQGGYTYKVSSDALFTSAYWGSSIPGRGSIYLKNVLMKNDVYQESTGSQNFEAFQVVWFGDDLDVEIYDSEFENVTAFMTDGGEGSLKAERNIVKHDSAFPSHRWDFGLGSGEISVEVRNNCFAVPLSFGGLNGGVLRQQTYQLNSNSIYFSEDEGLFRMSKISLAGSPGYFDATQNYWHGLTEADVKSLVRDKNSDISIPGEFRVTPLLSAPHSDTPSC